MKKSLALFFINFSIVNLCSANEVTGYYGGNLYEANSDTVITKTGVLASDVLQIQNNISLINYGQINSEKIVICDGCLLEFSNYGNVAAKFISDNNSSQLIQIVNCDNSATKIDAINGLDFSIKIESDDNLLMSNIENISSNADNIIFMDSQINMDKNLITKANVIISGELILDIENQNSDLPIMSNVFLNSGSVTINIKGLNSLYTAESFVQNDNLYYNVVRRTDYSDVLSDKNMGSFLNALRLSSPNDKTLKQMDAANDFNELKTVMDSSVILNPKNLMTPVKMFHQNQMMGFKDLSNFNNMSTDGIFILSDSVDMAGAKITNNININSKTNLKFSGYVSAFESSDNLNDFGGNLFGMNVGANYKTKLYWVDGIIGYTYSNFETDEIYTSNEIIKNPSAMSVYGSVDFGFDDYNYFDYKFKPFVGFGFDNYFIESFSDTDIFAKAGGIISYSEEFIGMKNDYDFILSLTTNNIYNIGARFKFLSVADNAGGNISYMMNISENNLAHQFLIGFNTIF